MTRNSSDYDFAIIGAGIAGVSIASELASTHRVVLIEREAQPGFHATGRSAAVFLPLYGADVVRKLTQASRPLLEHPPEHFANIPILKPRNLMVVASEEGRPLLEAFWSDPRTREHGRRLTGAEVRARVPIIRPEAAVEAVLDPTTAEVDVHALQEGFMRLARVSGVKLAFGCHISRLERIGQRWWVETDRGPLTASVLINAAGAWADHIATQAGVLKLGLMPCRRTAILVPAPNGHSIDDWPIVGDVGETFYFKPDGGALMISPSDEHLSEPCDAQAEELDVAIAVHRFEQATSIQASRVTHRWAGLRSFFPDRLPAVGYDKNETSFFWLAGQGGYGIQTAPALAALAASLARREGVPINLASQGIGAEGITPARLDGTMTPLLTSNLVHSLHKQVCNDV